jgi:hypothetical protein
MASSSPHKATDWKVGYTLSEPCGYTIIKNSDSIQLETSFNEKSKTHLITGFSILIPTEHDENEVITKADQQAKRLADVITFKREKRVVSHRTGIMERIEDDRWKLGKIFTARYHILKDIELDLGDNVIAQMIENDEEINQQLHHASVALGAEELDLFVTMFTELFQVIEKETTLQDYCKYKALRDAISHKELDPDRAFKRVNYWFPSPNHFEFTANYEFDHNSPKNLKQLKSEAYNLKKLVMSYLIAKMQ